MSKPSDWPLSGQALRILVPKMVLSELAENVLSRDCFPTALGYYPDAQRHQMRRMDHDDYLLMYCVAGLGELSTADYQGDVGSGDLIILPPGVPHQYAAKDASPWTIFWCHFRGCEADAFYQHIRFNEGSPMIRGLNDVALQSGFSSLMSISRTGYSLAAFIHAANQLRQILTLAERLRRRTARERTGSILAEIRDYMLDNLHRHLTLDDLATVGNLSKYHFNRKYRELTGYAPLQHFIHLKIEQACLLLDSSDMSISNIAFELGYDDPLYFSRVFRKVTGVAPSHYRKTLA
jgi:AraC-like DNA-binding protein